MLSINRIFILLIPALALAACASSPDRPVSLTQKLADKHYRLGEPVERIQNYKLDSWAYLDRQHVIMQTAPSSYYLVTLDRPCYELDRAEVLAFTTTSSQLTRFDKLLVTGPGGMLEKCYINTLNKLENIKKQQDV